MFIVDSVVVIDLAHISCSTLRVATLASQASPDLGSQDEPPKNSESDPVEGSPAFCGALARVRDRPRAPEPAKGSTHPEAEPL